MKYATKLTFMLIQHWFYKNRNLNYENLHLNQIIKNTVCVNDFFILYL